MFTNDHETIAEKKLSLSGTIILILVFINIIILRFAFVTDEKSYRLLAITLPLFFVSVFYHIHHKHFIRQRELAGNGKVDE